MCLILFAFKRHPVYKLIFAANRDEYYKRPTAPAGWWADTPSLLAGRDLQAGGTWLGITKQGKIAAVTNYRSRDPNREDALSRGALVTGYLSGNIPHDKFLAELPQKGADYNSFNLIFGSIDELYYFSNRKEGIRRLQPGLYGLSNAFLDTPWQKVLKGKKQLQEIILKKQEISPQVIFSLLADKKIAPDGKLPDTGVGIRLERVLSPLFIETEGYGTRSSTVILVDNDNRVTFVERSFVPQAENSFRFSLQEGNG